MRLSIVPVSALLLLAGCAANSGPVLSAAAFEQRFPPRIAVLQPGDKIKLALYEDPAFNGDYQISPDGTISLPLIGSVKAAGLEIEALRRTIETKLADGFYKNARVSAQVLSLQPVYVLGEVNQPNAYPYAPDLTLGKAAALAGGYTYRARMDRVVVQRAGTRQEVIVEANQTMALAPGDTVRILERYF